MKIKLKEILLLPNLISLFRLLLFLPFYFLLDNYNAGDSFHIYIIVLIFIAFISDILDGFIARKTNNISEFGKIIDPLADKILVSLIIIRLFILNEIPLYYFLIVVIRDVFILLGGIIISSKIGKVLPSNLLGKITVFAIGVFILLTISQINRSSIIYFLILLISCSLCIISFIGYTIRAIEMFNWNKNEINS